MKKSLITMAAALLTLGAYSSTPLWLRDARISPDGQHIAFCYKGDIYRVAANGGSAIRLTSQESYECSPVWSPDGTQIAFASDRYGSEDLFVMPAAGGQATRLTTYSGRECPWTFSPDGKYLYFSAAIQDPAQSALFPSNAMTELYRVPTGGGRIEQVLPTPAEAVCWNQSGTRFYYQDRKGGENEWRKHHTSSITRDLWVYDTTSGQHTNLTHRGGEDRNPVLSPDGTTLYFLSERNGGSFNVYAMPATGSGDVQAVTHFQTHPVRFLSIAREGTLCYAYDGELYTQRPDDTPKKVAIDLVRDDFQAPAHLSYSSGATSATASADGKQIAFVVRGEVFVTSVEYNTTKQITHTAAAEASPDFAPDGRTLAYATERNGNWQLCLARLTRTEETNFPNATRIEEEVILPSESIERAHPQFSPDGKELAYIEDRSRLMVLNLETRQTRQVTDGSQWYSTGGGFSYSWSPDGQWFTLEFIGNRHDPYSDIGLVSAQGGSITNLTNSGYSSESPRFVMKGNAILFLSERYGMRAHASWGSQQDAMLLFLNRDAYDKYCLSKEDYELKKELEKEQKKLKKTADDKGKKKSKESKEEKEDEEEKQTEPVTIDWDGLADRFVRLTPNSSNLADALLSDDGESLYYLSSFEKGFDLWKMDLRKKETKLLHKMDAGWSHLQQDKEGKHIFVLGGRSMQQLATSDDKLTPIRYQAELKMDLAEERAYMFEHVYRQEKRRFYNTNMHGVDWEAMCEAYRKFLPHINNNYDFSELLSEWLGELNVSHTGSGYRAPAAEEPTASLGLLYDWSYPGDGLRISEVLEKGPFDQANSQVKAGCIIEAIDGIALTATADCIEPLNGKARKKVLVSLFDPQSGRRWDEVVLPVSSGKLSDLLYQRWVKQRAADVERWSGGRLGYVHIRSMGDESFRNVYSDILGRYNHCEGIVIDTRFNGGGRLHEDIEILFSGQKYFTQVVRGREACDMPSRRWNKPSIMLICESNYSNAHGTPWVYRHREIGRLVGMPVPGTMTSVSWETLQDPSLYFGIPVVGYQLPDGGYLENRQLEPDIRVANAPERIAEGEDTQLRTAVEELLKEITN